MTEDKNDLQRERLVKEERTIRKKIAAFSVADNVPRHQLYNRIKPDSVVKSKTSLRTPKG